jgi:hypothetical protein
MANPMWNAILRWSIAQGAFQDDTPLEEHKPMSPERQEFLRKAFDSMVVDTFKRMKVLLEVLKIPLDGAALRLISQQLGELEEFKVENSADLSDTQLVYLVKGHKEQALDEMDDLVGQIDNATDLCKLGLDVVLQQLQSPFQSIRWRAAQVVSTVSQNNEAAQPLVTAAGAVPLLLQLLNLDPHLETTGLLAPPSVTEDQNDDAEEVVDETTPVTRLKLTVKTATKAVLALSSLLRYNSAGTTEFIEAKGLAALESSLLESPPRADKRLYKKVINLLRYFWRQPELRRSADRLLPVLIRLSGDDGDIDLREQSLSALLDLLDERNTANRLQLTPQARLELRETAGRRSKICSSYTDPDDVDCAAAELQMLTRLLRISNGSTA